MRPEKERVALPPGCPCRQEAIRACGMLRGDLKRESTYFPVPAGRGQGRWVTAEAVVPAAVNGTIRRAARRGPARLPALGARTFHRVRTLYDVRILQRLLRCRAAWARDAERPRFARGLRPVNACASNLPPAEWSAKSRLAPEPKFGGPRRISAIAWLRHCALTWLMLRRGQFPGGC